MHPTQLSFAPMEGLTSHIFRNIHNEMFPGADKYFAPFIAPDSSGKYKAGNLRDILPENNSTNTVPQILANNPAAFNSVADELTEMGYKEINLNVGCPSGTVVAKHKGAGMLADLATLDSFLDAVFSHARVDISVKTRMGMDSTDEFPQIIELYNKYPISRLTVHARDRAGQYKSVPDTALFIASMADIRAELEYNGDIFTPDDYFNICSNAAGISSVMLGRGAVCNPALFRRIRGGAELEKTELREFHNRLLSAFKDSGLNDRISMARLKELWHYIRCLFPDCRKELKSLNKTRSMSDYISAVDMLFSVCEFNPNGSYNKDDF